MCCEEELLSAGSGADEREIADGQDIENPAVWGGFLPPGVFISHTLRRFWKEGIHNTDSC